MNEAHIPQPRMNAQIALEAAQWFVANREGTLAPDQARAFMQWLQASPQHVAEYLEVVTIAEYAPGAAKQDPAALDDLLVQLRPEDNVVELEATGASRVFPDHAYPGPAKLTAARRTTHIRSRRSAFAWGAGVAALMAVATVGGVLSWSMGHADVRSYATAHGQQGEWTLPDGTRLRLNSESAATIRFDRSKRQVEVVHGQALFDIAQQPARPFEVRAGSHLIEDVGTVFDIYRQAGETTVTVTEGRVHVWNLPEAKSRRARAQRLPLVDLSSGERARISPSGAIARSRVDTRKALSWTRGEIVFENEPLAAVVTEFNRYSKVQVRIGEESIGDLAVSGTFSIHDENTFRAFLDSLPGVRAETTADGVIVRRRAIDRN